MDEAGLASKPFDIPKRLVWRAWEQVKANKGAAGVDGESIADFEVEVRNNLYRIWNRMSSGTYFPPPVRAVEIPKSSGGTRILGVPAVRDRIVQAACKIVLEPIFEADFLPCSFGFRPKRGQHDALQVLVDEAWRGRKWVVETDIANCFSAIPQEELIRAVEERVSDQAVLKLLRAMLRAGVMSDGVVRREVTGTPQGGLCAAAHNPPYGQCWVMGSGGCSAW